MLRGTCRATITSMQGSLVQLSVDEGDLCTSYEISIDSFLKGEWKVTKQKADIQKYSWDNFHVFRPCSNDTVIFMCVKGEVSRRLIELEMKHRSFCDTQRAQPTLRLHSSRFVVESCDVFVGNRTLFEPFGNISTV